MPVTSPSWERSPSWWGKPDTDCSAKIVVTWDVEQLTFQSLRCAIFPYVRFALWLPNQSNSEAASMFSTYSAYSAAYSANNLCCQKYRSKFIRYGDTGTNNMFSSWICPLSHCPVINISIRPSTRPYIHSPTHLHSRPSTYLDHILLLLLIITVTITTYHIYW